MTPEPHLRVLVVSLGRRGGVPEYGWLMTRALARRTDVAVIHSAYAANRDKWARLDRPRLEVKTFSSLLGLVASFLAVRRFARIARFARRFRPDIVYYPGWHPWKPLLDLLLPRSAATVLTVHDAELHPGEDSLAFRLLSWAARRRAAGYILLSERQRSGFVARFGLEPSRVIAIPHGVFDDFGTNAGGDPTDLGIPAADLGRYLLFMGRFLPYKGIDTLLAAYAGLPPAEAPPLVVAGSGDLSTHEKHALEGLAGRGVVIINKWVSDAEMASLVGSARFVVLPYRSATQSGVIPLAFAYGIPAIAAATGGLVEQVIEGETGFLFPPGDAEALRALIARTSRIDDATYGRLSSQAMKYASTEWAWDSLSSRLADFFGSITS
jgi:glycosyltransferase involved in cell wall biosynthesis